MLTVSRLGASGKKTFTLTNVQPLCVNRFMAKDTRKLCLSKVKTHARFSLQTCPGSQRLPGRHSQIRKHRICPAKGHGNDEAPEGTESEP